jgi:hypothetical protein
MPGLLPILLTGSYIVLAADKIPELNIEPTCRAAVTTNVRPVAGQDDSPCKRDEATARETLEQTWGQFTAPQRAQCVRLSTLGGSPSYVELLTCLELNKAAADLPNEAKSTDSAKR